MNAVPLLQYRRLTGDSVATVGAGRNEWHLLGRGHHLVEILEQFSNLVIKVIYEILYLDGDVWLQF